MFVFLRRAIFKSIQNINKCKALKRLLLPTSFSIGQCKCHICRDSHKSLRIEKLETCAPLFSTESYRNDCTGFSSEFSRKGDARIFKIHQYVTCQTLGNYKSEFRKTS